MLSRFFFPSAVNVVFHLDFTLVFKAAVEIVSSANNKQTNKQTKWKSKPRVLLAPEFYK